MDDMITAFVALTATPADFSIRQLAEKVVALTGSKARIAYCPLPIDDPTQPQPDISLAREGPGWRPKAQQEVWPAKTAVCFEGLPAGSS